MVIILKTRSPYVAACLKAVACVRLPIRSVGLLTAGLVLSAMATVDPTPLPAAPAPQRVDARVARLERFFRRYHCPEPFYIHRYLRAADGYHLDYRLLPAISIRETRCGVEEWRNNRWGYHPRRQSFDSVEQGIGYISWQLAEGPFYKNKTLEQKLFTYNPLPAYPREVQSIMRQIE